jgi:hypothetical protein
MTLQTPIIIQVQERWSSGAGFTILISDKKTAYSIGFHERGDLLVHACKLQSGEIEFAHSPIRGVAIDLNHSTYESWGLSPKSMSTIYSLFELQYSGKNVIKLRESLAELEHEQWADWTKHMLQSINLDNVTRWQKLIETPYVMLTEEQKVSDRLYADKVLEILLKGVPE